MPKERVERDEEDLVRLYLTDIGQYPLLTKDDEVRLAQAIEAGMAGRAELDAGGRGLPAARKRELRRVVHAGEHAQQTHFDSAEMVEMATACTGLLSRPPTIDLFEGLSAHDLA